MTTRSTPRFQTLGYDEASPASALKDDRVNLRAASEILVVYGRLIMIAVLVSAAVGYGLARAVDKTYEARATVFVTAPTFSSQLTPQPFSIEAYERLAQSDYIRQRVTQELRDRKLLAPDERPSSLLTHLYPSREPLKPFLPLVELIARGRTPELAQALANSWADIFMAEQTKLAVIGKASSVDFVLQEFPKASSRVLETQRLLNDQQARLDREYSVQEASAGVDLKKSRLAALESSIVRTETELLGTQVDLKQGRERLARLETEVAAAKPVLTMEKGPTDEAIWNSALRGDNRAGADAALGKLTIRTEQPNPVYTSLSQNLADSRVTLGALQARETMLLTQLQQIRKDAAALRVDFYDSKNRLEALVREHVVQLGPGRLAVDEAKARFNKLSDKIGDAQIAKAESDSNVKLGAYAELPIYPIAPSAKLYVAFAMAIGFLGALLALFVLNYLGLLPVARAGQSPRPAVTT